MSKFRKKMPAAVFIGVLVVATSGTALKQKALRSEFEDRLRRWEIESYFEVVSVKPVGWLAWEQEARLTLKPGRTWQEVGDLLKRKNPTTFKTFTASEIVVQQGDLGVFLTRRANEIEASATNL